MINAWDPYLPGEKRKTIRFMDSSLPCKAKQGYSKNETKKKTKVHYTELREESQPLLLAPSKDWISSVIMRSDAIPENYHLIWKFDNFRSKAKAGPEIINMINPSKNPEYLYVPKKKQRPMLVRVGGGWMVPEQYYDRYRKPTRIIEVNRALRRPVSDKYYFLGPKRRISSANASTRFGMYRERPWVIPDAPF